MNAVMKGIEQIPVRDEFDRVQTRALNAYRAGRMPLSEQVKYALTGAGVDPAKVERGEEIKVSVDYTRKSTVGKLVSGKIILHYKRKDARQVVSEVRFSGGVHEVTSLDGLTVYREAPLKSETVGLHYGAVVPRLVLAGIEFEDFSTGIPRVVYDHYVEIVGAPRDSSSPILVGKDEIPTSIGATSRTVIV